MPPSLQFWYELASNYSYLSAIRIDELAKASGVSIIWRPFTLGPIFKAQGWNTSPFNIYEAKGRHMRRDMERIAQDRGIAFVMPAVFPANALLVARIALLGEDNGWTPNFSRAVFEAGFGKGQDIANEDTVRTILSQLNLDADDLLARAATSETKEHLKKRTAEARRLGIFGAPTFVTQDGEIFWGDDRLEHALRWAQKNETRH